MTSTYNAKGTLNIFVNGLSFPFLFSLFLPAPSLSLPLDSLYWPHWLPEISAYQPASYTLLIPNEGPLTEAQDQKIKKRAVRADLVMPSDELCDHCSSSWIVYIRYYHERSSSPDVESSASGIRCDFILLTNSQVSLILFHGCWWETWDSWIKNKRLITHDRRSNMIISLFASFRLALEFHKSDPMGPGQYCTRGGSMSPPRDTEVGRSSAFITNSKQAAL